MKTLSVIFVSQYVSSFGMTFSSTTVKTATSWSFAKNVTCVCIRPAMVSQIYQTVLGTVDSVRWKRIQLHDVHSARIKVVQ